MRGRLDAGEAAGTAAPGGVGLTQAGRVALPRASSRSSPRDDPQATADSASAAANQIFILSMLRCPPIVRRFIASLGTEAHPYWTLDDDGLFVVR